MRPIFTRRLWRPLLSILRMRTARERPVDARCVPPQACRSSPTISTTRTLPSDAGGGATERQRIRPGSLPSASAATQETRSGRSWRMTSLSCGSRARSLSLSTSGRSKCAPEDLEDERVEHVGVGVQLGLERAERRIDRQLRHAGRLDGLGKQMPHAPILRDLEAGDPRLARGPGEATAIGKLAATAGMKRALLEHDGAGPGVE